MSQFGAPSFSLGLDLDLDLDPDLDRGGDASTSAAPTFRILHSGDEGGGGGDSDHDEFDGGVLGRDGDGAVRDPPPRDLKRLRRGPPTVATPSSAPPLMQAVPAVNVDEEIEEFSSDDGPCVGSCTTTHDRFLHRSSKLSLGHQRVLSKDSSGKLGCKGSSSAFDSSYFRRSIAADRQGILPELTISPLRKIQCLDSDSDDDPSSSICDQRKNEMEDPTNGIIRNNKTGAKFVANITEKEVHQKPLGHFATPVLDSFCEEYFASTKEKKVSPGNRCDLGVNISKSNLDCLGRPTASTSSVNNFNGIADHSWSSTNYIPPCFNYYNHTDSRICELVQNRLPNFIPIGAEMQRSNQTSEMSSIDYMAQFLRRDTPTPANCASKDNGSFEGTKRRERNVKNVKSKEPQIAGDWVNPKDNSSIPLDAGKRRVHANTQGHWITNQDGRKVYISKNGQELAGQAAYRHYRKESGMGFKKSGKKSVRKRTKKQ